LHRNSHFIHQVIIYLNQQLMNNFKSLFKDETIFSICLPAEERAGGNYPSGSSTPLCPRVTAGDPGLDLLPAKRNDEVPV
jgi:hypothetical protein